MRAPLRTLAASALAVGALAAPAQAEPSGSQYLLGDDAEVSYPDIAFDTSGRALTVWQEQDRSTGGKVVRGREVTAAGPSSGPDTLAGPAPTTVPAVAHGLRGHVLVWSEHGSIRSKLADARTARTVAEAAEGESLSDPAITHNPANGEFLVAWTRSRGESVSHVMTRRLSAEGVPQGDQYRAADLSGRNEEPDVTATSGGYLVVWQRVVGNLGNDGLEIHGQRITTANRETGGDDFKISSHRNLAGRTLNRYPAVAWNPSRREALVVFSDGYEAFAQRLSASASRIGSNARLSKMGPDGDRRYTVGRVDVAFSARAGGYLVTWISNNEVDDDAPQMNVFGQHLSGSGSQVGENDFRISTESYLDYLDDLAVAADPSSRDYVALWAVGEIGVYGRRIGAP